MLFQFLKQICRSGLMQDLNCNCIKMQTVFFFYIDLEMVFKIDLELKLVVMNKNIKKLGNKKIVKFTNSHG